MTVALVDGDIVAYRSAASAEKDDENIALIRASRTLQDIVSTVGADECKVFISGSTNFRKDIYPEYKANRDRLVRPRWLQSVREYLVLEWGATVSDGHEADDALGVAMGEYHGGVCCSIDKDLLQLEGAHYNFVTETFREIDYLEGWRNFYKQLVLGDKGDNVPGYDGKMRVKWPKFLEETRVGLETARDISRMYSIVAGIYRGTTEELIRNGRLLYIWRKENDVWTPPTQAETTSEARQEGVTSSESTPMMQGVISLSTGPTGTRPKKGGSSQRGRPKGSVKVKKRRGR